MIQIRVSLIAVIGCSMLLASCSSKGDLQIAELKPALIVTTDIGGDPDDMQSLTRLLLYSNDFEILGLISSASGTRNELGVDTIKPQLIHEFINAYAEVRSNLVLHDPDYPTAEALRSVVKKGNPYRGSEHIGEGHDTEASQWIISQVDGYPGGRVNIAIWGGQTDVAQALWSVKNGRSRKEYDAFISRIRIYDIMDQDWIYEEIRREHPGLLYVRAKAPEDMDKREAVFRGMYLGGDESLTSKAWIDSHVRLNHGPLGALYPRETWTAPNPHGCLKEGDTPSWFFFLKNGLQDPDHPEWGGWGGRFLADNNRYFIDDRDIIDSVTLARATVFRWRRAFQNAFSARMDWCVKSPERANHAPELVVNGVAGSEVMVIDARPASTVSFDASGSWDPDGDTLQYLWWIYREPGTLDQYVEITPTDQPAVNLNLPEEATGDLHLILEVSDSGSPSLTSYRRSVLKVR